MYQIWTSWDQRFSSVITHYLELFCFELILETAIFTNYCKVLSLLVGAWLWPLAHRELIRPLTSLRSYAKVPLARHATILPNKRSDEGCVGTDHQEKYGEWKRGWGGGRIKAKYQKKTWKGEFCEKKFVHSEKPKKDSCIGLPKDFTEILAMRVREQTEVISFCNKKVPSFLAFVQSDILTSKLFFICLILSPRWINTVRG